MNPAKVTLCAVFVILMVAPVMADEAEAVTLTVYMDGHVIVRDVRSMLLPEGTGQIRFEDVAATIDPTTVRFRSLSDPEGTFILEQQYEYDLVSADRLLEKYLGTDVQITTEDGTTHRGVLIAFDSQQLVVSQQDGDAIRIIARPGNVRDIVGSMPVDQLVTKPTLSWLISSATGGSQQIELAYSASDCSWRADYSALLNEDETMLDLTSWVTVTNNTGKTYTEARLKLLAGEVSRVAEARPRVERAMLAAPAAPPGFEDQPFAEYHLYTLPRRTTIKDRQKKQIELMRAREVPCEKKYVFEHPMRGFRLHGREPDMRDFPRADAGEVDVFIRFENDQASNLGVPLPAGRVRLFKMDGDDSEFVGEDAISHTPKDELVEVTMGKAFDVVAERIRTDFTRAPGANWMEESFEIKIRNHKDQPVTVRSRERLFRWMNWTIIDASHDYEQIDAQTVEFPIRAEADSQAVMVFTVRYDW